MAVQVVLLWPAAVPPLVTWQITPTVVPLAMERSVLPVFGAVGLRCSRAGADWPGVAEPAVGPARTARPRVVAVLGRWVPLGGAAVLLVPNAAVTPVSPQRRPRPRSAAQCGATGLPRP